MSWSDWTTDWRSCCRLRYSQCYISCHIQSIWSYMVFLNHIFSYALVEGGLMLALVRMFPLAFSARWNTFSTMLLCVIFSLLLCASREQACHAAFFLKCLNRATPFDGPDSLKCLPNNSGSLKCLLYRCVAIQFRSWSASLLQWSMLLHFFVPWFLFLFDSTLQSWGPTVAVQPLRGCSLVCCSSTLQVVGSVVAVSSFWGCALVVPRWQVSFPVVVFQWWGSLPPNFVADHLFLCS